MTRRGFLLLLDLSGYTEFLTLSDLEQAPGILQSLLGTLAHAITPPLVIAELEGDAIFAWAPDAAFAGAELTERIGALYCEFAAAREQMERNAACDCTGCRSFPLLDLKIIAHHGTFALRSMLPGQPSKPVGTDVIAAHRLLKNGITKATGIRAYGFITDACRDAVGLDAQPLELRRHQESYDHIGTISGSVIDLEEVWRKERGRRLVSVRAGEAWVEAGTMIDASPQAVWDVISGPAFRALWRDPARAPGSLEPRSAQHCYTGGPVATDGIADWQPPERLTFACEWPAGTRVLITSELNGMEDGCTRLVTRVGVPGHISPAPDLPGPPDVGQIERLCRANHEVLRGWLQRRVQPMASGLRIVRPEV